MPSGRLTISRRTLPPGPQRPHPRAQVPRIRLIGPDHAQAGEVVPQDLQQGHGAVAVLHTGGGDHDAEEQP